MQPKSIIASSAPAQFGGVSTGSDRRNEQSFAGGKRQQLDCGNVTTADNTASTSSNIRLPALSVAFNQRHEWLSPAGARCLVGVAIDQVNTASYGQQKQASRETVREGVIDFFGCVVDDVVERAVKGASQYARHRGESSIGKDDVLRYLETHFTDPSD